MQRIHSWAKPVELTGFVVEIFDCNNSHFFRRQYKYIIIWKSVSIITPCKSNKNMTKTSTKRLQLSGVAQKSASRKPDRTVMRKLADGVCGRRRDTATLWTTLRYALGFVLTVQKQPVRRYRYNVGQTKKSAESVESARHRYTKGNISRRYSRFGRLTHKDMHGFSNPLFIIIGEDALMWSRRIGLQGCLWRFSCRFMQRNVGKVHTYVCNP